MLDALADEDDAEKYVKKLLDRGDRLMGFGHRVYRAEDPRARVLRRTAREIGAPRLEVAEELEKAALAELKARKPDRVLATNVEFWSAVVLDFAGVPPSLHADVLVRARPDGPGAHPRAEARGPADPPDRQVRRAAAPQARGRGGEPRRRPLMETATAVSSFAKSLFLGEIHEELVFPFQAGPEEQDKIRALIARLREIAAELIDPRKAEEQGWIGDDVIAALGEAGLCGLHVDEEYGGQGCRRRATAACPRSSRRSTRRCR